MRTALALATLVSALVWSASALAGGGRPTAVYTYQPFGTSGLRRAIQVDQTVTGRCPAGSQASPRRDAWRCVAGGDVYDPCFSGPSRASRFVVCPGYVSTRQVVRMNLRRSLPSRGNRGIPGARRGSPWALVAVPYAHQCRRVTGAHRSFRGKPIGYTCLQGELVGALSRRGPRWHARYLSEGDNPTLYRLRVTAAWF